MRALLLSLLILLPTLASAAERERAICLDELAKYEFGGLRNPYHNPDDQDQGHSVIFRNGQKQVFRWYGDRISDLRRQLIWSRVRLNDHTSGRENTSYSDEQINSVLDALISKLMTGFANDLQQAQYRPAKFVGNTSTARILNACGQLSTPMAFEARTLTLASYYRYIATMHPEALIERLSGAKTDASRTGVR